MNYTLRFTWIVIANILITTSIFAQKKRIYPTPPQQGWNGQENVTKLKLTKKQTVIYFEIAIELTEYSDVTFYPPTSMNSWYLRIKNDDMDKKLHLEAIKNIRHNNTPMVKVLQKEQSFKNINDDKNNKVNYFSCELYFPRLPKNTVQFDLIEGLGKENNPNHFNVFDIQLEKPIAKH